MSEAASIILRNDGPDLTVGHQLLRHGERRALGAAEARRLAGRHPTLTIIGAYDADGAPVAGPALPADGQARAAELQPGEITRLADLVGTLIDEAGAPVAVPDGDLAADLAAPATLAEGDTPTTTTRRKR